MLLMVDLTLLSVNSKEVSLIFQQNFIPDFLLINLLDMYQRWIEEEGMELNDLPFYFVNTKNINDVVLFF